MIDQSIGSTFQDLAVDVVFTDADVAGLKTLHRLAVRAGQADEDRCCFWASSGVCPNATAAANITTRHHLRITAVLSMLFDRHCQRSLPYDVALQGGLTAIVLKSTALFRIRRRRRSLVLRYCSDGVQNCVSRFRPGFWLRIRYDP